MTPTTPPGDVAHDVFVACVGVSRLARFSASTVLAPHQFNALAWVEDGVNTAGEIAERERVSAPSMSRTVSGLVDHGLLQRAGDPEDGRRLVLTLTDAGRAALDQVRAERNRWMAELLESCTEEERATLGEAALVLRRLVDW